MSERGVVSVGVCDPDSSGAALRWAAREASRRRAQLRVLHAVHHGLLPGTPEEHRAAVARAAARVLQQACAAVREAAPGLRVSTHTVHGRARDVLAGAAAGSDLVVVGARGRSGAPGLALGSTSAALAGTCPVPLVVLAHDPVRGASGVLVGVDGSADARAAVRFAARAAERSGEGLTVLHAWDDLDTYPGLAVHPGPGAASRPGGPSTAPGGGGSAPGDGREAAGTAGREAAGTAGPVVAWFAGRSATLLDEAVELALETCPGVRVHPLSVRAPSTAGAVLRASRGARLLVLGARGDRHPSARAVAPTGAVTRALLHTARAPVAVVAAGPA
ncbi:universal stress protein [Kineococcus gypseus]|uniref:universal stress protein n=1 Tax=Kineococcus gypseus TaxID=1637102 RepID=UPI003D7CA8A3